MRMIGEAGVLHYQVTLQRQHCIEIELTYIVRYEAGEGEQCQRS